MQRSFSNVIIHVLSIICFIVGLLLLLITKKVTMHAMYGLNAEVANVIVKFLGSAYVLIAFMMYLIKNFRGKKLIYAIISFNLVGFINLHLLYMCSELIHLSNIYFTFQAIVQICLIFCVFDAINDNELRKGKERKR